MKGPAQKKSPVSQKPRAPVPTAAKKAPAAKQSNGALDNFVVEKTLGVGPYSRVVLAQDAQHQRKVGIKIYEKSSLCDIRRKSEVRREVTIMQQLSHPNVIRLHQVLDKPKQLCLVMEYVPGISLWQYIRDAPGSRLVEDQARFFFKQLLQGVSYCHSKLIAHRDIKLENILLDQDFTVKLIDFGFATCLPKNKKLHVFCGTPWYMAPEIINDKPFCGHAADVWALGVLLYTALTGSFPITATNNDELFRRIKVGGYQVPNWVSLAAKELIESMLQYDPAQRPTCSQLLNSTWFTLTPDDEILEFMAEHGYMPEEVLHVLGSSNNAVNDVYNTLASQKAQGQALSLAE